MMRVSSLWAAPEINPISRKARSIPVLNVFNVYGRVFFFSWWGFMVAFWAWYTFPPLLTRIITENLHLTSVQVANSNIVSLCATFLIRFAAGPACDLVGPRWVFGGLLIIGSIPLGLAPLVHDARGLYVSRFFIGILGGTFVPCQVWATGFFDKNIVGTANALTGGWGNAGGGITYFIMPAVFDSLVRAGHGDGAAWRLTFLVPLAFTLTTAIAMILLCPDTPTGRWSERLAHAEQNLMSHHGGGDRRAARTDGHVVDVPGSITDRTISGEAGSSEAAKPDAEDEAKRSSHDDDDDQQQRAGAASWDHEAALGQTEMEAVAHGETVVKPTAREAVGVLASGPTLFLAAAYLCSFGAELAVDASLSAYLGQGFPALGKTEAADWAAMFGFLNVVTRPLGGLVADRLYRAFAGPGRGLWAKKLWVVACGCLAGMTFIVIGRVDPRAASSGGGGDEKQLSTMLGLVALLAVFVEGGNGANFALVPHVHPRANGVVSGATGACGNLGGILFSVVFRFVGGSGTDYADAFWIIGVVTIAVNLGLCWVPPIPRGQLGGH
ncbi:nitrate transporter [Xylariaceae sp. FL0804]|nr:nitrate transporter [Xylariaceae sp. FL0804]